MPETRDTLGEIERMLFLRRVPLFSELAPEDLQRIGATAVERVYPADEAIVREGELGRRALRHRRGHASGSSAAASPTERATHPDVRGGRPHRRARRPPRAAAGGDGHRRRRRASAASSSAARG